MILSSACHDIIRLVLDLKNNVSKGGYLTVETCEKRWVTLPCFWKHNNVQNSMKIDYKLLEAHALFMMYIEYNCILHDGDIYMLVLLHKAKLSNTVYQR